MRTILLISMLLLIGYLSKAQNCNLIFFSEEGEQFTVVIDGILFNEKAETNVKITDVTTTTHSVKILFQDEKIKPIKKNVFLEVPNKEQTYVVKQNKKGVYKLRFRGETDIVVEPKVNTAKSTPNSVAMAHSTNTSQATVQTQTTVQQNVSTSTPTSNKTNSENVNLGINIGDGANNVNFNFNVTSSTTQSTQTSQSTQATVNTQQQTVFDDVPPPPPPIPGYNGPYGCPYPMDASAFQSAKRSIKSKSFEDTKMTLAKQIAKANCLSVAQVKEILELFTFEDNKLEYAKFVYDYTCDVGNFYLVNDVFTFESTVEELDAYLSTK